MQFDKSYWTAMDKESLQQYNVNPSYLGISARFFEKQLGALQARIKLGAKNVELGFMGRGKGSVINNITPGMHGKTEREEMRQLAKINEVGLTTHASCAAGGFAGFGDRGFNEASRESNVREVKRAMDFAADVAGGGPVTVHVGEFTRPIHGVEGDKFIGYPGEEAEKTHYLVDKKTGQIFSAVREDETIFIPVPMLDKDGNKLQKLDSQGEPVTVKDVFDKDEPIYLPKQDKEGTIQLKKWTYKDFKKKKMEEEGYTEDQIPKLFFWEQKKRDIESAMGSADEYEVMYRESRDALKSLRKLKKQYLELEKDADAEGLERLKREIAKHRIAGSFVPQAYVESTFKKPSEIIQGGIWELTKRMSYGQEVATSSRRNMAKINELVDNADSIEDYGIKKTADSLARLGLYAIDKEKYAKKKGWYTKPMFVAPEQVFPEQYGAHPDELKKIIQESRKAMANMLVKKKGMGRGAANSEAKKRIKATFDIGHANTWRKYFDGSDEDFDKWMIKKVKELAEQGYLGHVHLSDNFGYEDEHLASGEGNAPVKDFIKTLRKKGYKGPLIVEGGAQGKDREHEALIRTMRHLDSPIYTIDGDTTTWSEAHQSYFGRVRAGPPYVIGAYAPDIDMPTEHRSWTFWSGVPME